MKGTTHAVLVALLATSVASAQDSLESAIAAYELAESVDAKIDALEAMSKLDAPPDALTRALTLGLTDESGRVCAAAVRLVAGAPDRDIALDALLDACRSLPGRLEVLRKKLLEARATMSPNDFKLEKPSGEGKTVEEWMKGVKRAMEGTATMTELIEDGSAPFEPLCDALIGVRDDRAIEGMAMLLEHAGSGESGLRLTEALLELGTKPALVAACSHLKAYEKRHDAQRKAWNEARRARPGPKPDLWQGSSKAWKEREENRLRAAIDSARAALDAKDAETEAFAERLRRFAEAKGLSSAPTGSSAASWRSWARRQQTLPDHLADHEGSGGDRS